MVQKSFISEAYTNLCKDKDTYFYNFLKKSGNTYNVQNPSITRDSNMIAANTNNKCRKLCDTSNANNKNSCVLYTLNHSFNTANSYSPNIDPNNGACTIYSKQDLADISYMLVDCGNKSMYRGIPVDTTDSETGSSITNKVNFGIPGINSETLEISTGNTKGYGYLDPKFFRENVNKFKNMNYLHEKIKLIINEFEQLRTQVKNFTENITIIKDAQALHPSLKDNTDIPSWKYILGDSYN